MDNVNRRCAGCGCCPATGSCGLRGPRTARPRASWRARYPPNATLTNARAQQACRQQEDARLDKLNLTAYTPCCTHSVHHGIKHAESQALRTCVRDAGTYGETTSTSSCTRVASAIHLFKELRELLSRVNFSIMDFDVHVSAGALGSFQRTRPGYPAHHTYTHMAAHDANARACECAKR